MIKTIESQVDRDGGIDVGEIGDEILVEPGG